MGIVISLTRIYYSRLISDLLISQLYHVRDYFSKCHVRKNKPLLKYLGRWTTRFLNSRAACKRGLLVTATRTAMDDIVDKDVTVRAKIVMALWTLIATHRAYAFSC